MSNFFLSCMFSLIPSAFLFSLLIVLDIFIQPSSSNVTRPLSNKASRLAFSRKPLYLLMRCFASVHSAQGIAWLARSAEGRSHPVTAHLLSQYCINKRLYNPCPRLERTSAMRSVFSSPFLSKLGRMSSKNSLKADSASFSVKKYEK